MAPQGVLTPTGTHSPGEARVCGQSTLYTLRSNSNPGSHLTLDKSGCLFEPWLSHLQSACKMTRPTALFGLNAVVYRGLCWCHEC